MADPLDTPTSAGLWRNRDFVVLWSGQCVSVVGSGISQLAFPLLVLALTGSPAAAGLVGAVRALPNFLFGLPAGALIDRWDRKRVMIICDTVRALSLASIAVALAIGHLTLTQLFINGFLEGTLFVFFTLANLAAIPRIVSEEQLPEANAATNTAFGVATLVGPLLGGTFFAVTHALPFVADATSYAVSVASLFMVRAAFQRITRNVELSALRAEILEGLHWLLSHPTLRFVAVLNAGFNFVFAGVGLLVIVLAQRLHAGGVVIGLIFTVSGIGSILGAVVSARVYRWLGFSRVMTLEVWLPTLLWPLMLVVPNPLAFGIIMGGLFVGSQVYQNAQLNYRLAVTPDALQGRVNSAFRLIVMSCSPLGQLATGFLLQRFGAIPTVLVFWCVLLMLAVSTNLNPSVRVASHRAEPQVL